MFAEIDAFMDGPDKGLEAGKDVFDGLSKEIWILATENIGGLLAVSNRKQC